MLNLFGNKAAQKMISMRIVLQIKISVSKNLKFMKYNNFGNSKMKIKLFVIFHCMYDFKLTRLLNISKIPISLLKGIYTDIIKTTSSIHYMIIHFLRSSENSKIKCFFTIKRFIFLNTYIQ